MPFMFGPDLLPYRLEPAKATCCCGAPWEIPVPILTSPCPSEDAMPIELVCRGRYERDGWAELDVTDLLLTGEEGRLGEPE